MWESRGIRQEANTCTFCIKCAYTGFVQCIENIVTKMKWKKFDLWERGFRVVFCSADVHPSIAKSITQHLSSENW